MYNNLFQRLFLTAVLTIAAGFLLSQKAIVGLGYGIGAVSVIVFVWDMLLLSNSKSVTAELDDANSTDWKTQAGANND